MLSWTAVSGATSYNVYTSSTSPASTSSTKTTVSGTSTTLSSLTNGTPVFVAVTAVNGGGESALSSEVCAVPTPASTTGLTLYDPLCGSTLDGAKWQPPGLFTRGVSGGAMVLSAHSSNMEANGTRGFVNQTVAVVNSSQRVTTLQATIRMPAGSISRSTGVEARAVLRLMYQPPANRLDVPAGNLDLLTIQVGLEDVGNGLVAIRRVTHCDNAACSTESSSGITFSDPGGFNGTVAAAYDTTYTIRASLNETTGVFSWTISGGTLGSLSGTADPTAYLAANANWVAVGANPLAGNGFFAGLLRTRVLGLTGGLSASISAQFDDVLVGLDNAAATAYDDFSGTSGNSGPLELRADKWTAGEHSRAMAGGSLAERSRVTSPDTNGVSYFQAVLFSDPAASNTIQADVTVNACSNSTGSTNRVELVGTLYNDGHPGTGTPPDTNQANSSVGDVQAHLMLDCVLGQARFQLIRWNTQSPQVGILISSSVNNTVPMGSNPVVGYMHTLRMRWDPVLHQVTFQVDGAAPVVVDPTTASAQITNPRPFVKAANSPFRAIGESLFIPNAGGSAGATASIDYKVNNVFTAP